MEVSSETGHGGNDPSRGWISAVALGVLLVGLGFSLLQRGSVGDGAASSKEVLETTKGLRVTQLQAVDLLEIVQDQLSAQKAETKKLSEQIATLTERLDALQQSIAITPIPEANRIRPTRMGRPCWPDD